MNPDKIKKLLAEDGICAEVNGNKIIVEVIDYEPYEYEVRGDTLYRDNMKCVTGDSEKAEAWIFDEVIGLYLDIDADVLFA